MLASSGGSDGGHSPVRTSALTRQLARSARCVAFPRMRYVDAPLVDEPLSVVGFGCWQLSGPGVWSEYDETTAVASVHRAIDVGIDFFDVAPVYGLGHAEEVLGRALAGRRDDVLVASKFGLVWDDAGNVRNDGTADSVRAEVDASLRRLDTDRIDLYQMHWPDPDCDIDDTMAAVLELRDAGKIRYVGVSNFSLDEVDRARRSGEVATYQGLLNLLEHDPTSYHGIELEYRSRSEVLPYVVEAGMVFLPYSPLLQGLLTDDEPDMNGLDPVDVRRENPKLAHAAAGANAAAAADLRALAVEMGRPLNQLAINWLAAQPGMGPVIAGSPTPEHVDANAGAGDWEPTEDDLEAVDHVLARHADLLG